MKNSIAVIGSGSWGTALSILLAKNGHSINLWSWQEEESKRLAELRENKEFLPGVGLHDNINCTWDIEKSLFSTNVIVIAVPSKAVRATIKQMKRYVKEGQVIVIVSKGFEEKSFLRLSEVATQELPHTKIAVMSGPSHAEEVARDIPTTNVVASSKREIAEYIQDVFMNSRFRVYTNPDIIGVELGGALKNVIALSAGISDGLGYGDNTKAALMTRGITEIARLGKALGARLQTFAGLSGIGDLIVTCTSMHSRNRRAGILIGQGKTLEETLNEIHMVVEGVNATEAAYNLALINNVEMPIVNQAYKVLFENKSPNTSVEDLMLRSRTHEIEEVVDAENGNWYM
jgi:glycerol-3-phosphate dehydrogenase (NAD(P)+)